jgi:hypothetical protein
MQPITKADVYFDYQINRMVEEQKKTNELLQQLLDAFKPPIEGVEKVERNGNDKLDKRKRR